MGTPVTLAISVKLKRHMSFSISLKGKYASLMQYIANLLLVNSFLFYNSEIILWWTSSFCSLRNYADTELSEYDLSLCSLRMTWSISNWILPSIFISLVSLVPKAFDEKVLLLIFENECLTLLKWGYLFIFRASLLLIMYGKSKFTML